MCDFLRRSSNPADLRPRRGDPADPAPLAVEAGAPRRCAGGRVRRGGPRWRGFRARIVALFSRFHPDLPRHPVHRLRRDHRAALGAAAAAPSQRRASGSVSRRARAVAPGGNHQCRRSGSAEPGDPARPRRRWCDALSNRPSKRFVRSSTAAVSSEDSCAATSARLRSSPLPPSRFSRWVRPSCATPSRPCSSCRGASKRRCRIASKSRRGT